MPSANVIFADVQFPLYFVLFLVPTIISSFHCKLTELLFHFSNPYRALHNLFRMIIIKHITFRYVAQCLFARLMPFIGAIFHLCFFFLSLFFFKLESNFFSCAANRYSYQDNTNWQLLNWLSSARDYTK